MLRLNYRDKHERKEGVFLLSNLNQVVINMEECYFLKDVFKQTEYKAYVPEHLAKLAGRSEIRSYREPLSDKELICVTKTGAKNIIKQKGKSKYRCQKYTLVQKEKLARMYHRSYGWIEAHIMLGDLDQQLKYIEENEGISPAKAYDRRDFFRRTPW